VTLADGRTLTPALFDQLFEEEMEAIRGEVGQDRFGGGQFAVAGGLFNEMSKREPLVDFLTLPAYDALTRAGG
jgi:malate synthase